MSWPNLAPDVSSRLIAIDGLDMHILEASPATDSAGQRPLVILLHGFPELAYSWRKIMTPLCRAGYHVVAPDQRGYGRTKAAKPEGQVVSDAIQFDDELSSFRMLNLVKDIVALVHYLGYTVVEAVVGHDFGSLVAAHLALIRPDLFKSVVLMSAPFPGAPNFLSSKKIVQKSPKLEDIDPPRKHYTAYFSSREANIHMHNPPQGMHAFLRAYFHMKSGDWSHNDPYPLPSAAASDLAVLPNYYVMPLHESMPQVVEKDAPSPEEVSKNRWLTDEELSVYTTEFSRTGFQGGLNWYRGMADARWADDLKVFSGKKIQIPAMYIAGKKDWGVYQSPGAFEAMQEKVCTNMSRENVVLLEGAGHWVQQEQADELVKHLLRFMAQLG